MISAVFNGMGLQFQHRHMDGELLRKRGVTDLFTRRHHLRLNRPLPPPHTIPQLPQRRLRPLILPPRPRMVLHQRTARRRIAHTHPHIIQPLMAIQPLDRVARHLHELRPLVDGEREGEVRGAGVADAHEDAPEDHGDGGVEEEEEAACRGGVGPTEAEAVGETPLPVFHLEEQRVQFFVGCLVQS